MARPVTYDTEELLASARQTFLEVGPSASTHVLAKNAGVSEGTLFKRFGSKKNLFLQAIKFEPIENRAWFTDLLKLRETRSLEEVLVEAGLGLQEHFAHALPSIQMLMAYPDLSAADHRTVMGDDNPLPVAIKRRFRDLFEAEIASGHIPQNDAYVLACLYAGAIINDAHHRLILEVRDEEEDPEAFVRRTARTFTSLLHPPA
jgi:AcrR family transcriptional regulator